MDEYYTVQIIVNRVSHPKGAPKHNDGSVVEITNIKAKAGTISDLVERAKAHVELIDE